MWWTPRVCATPSVRQRVCLMVPIEPLDRRARSMGKMNQRGRTLSPRWREAPPPAPRCQTKRQSEARPGAGPGSYTQGGMARRAPRVLGQDCGPAPAPPQRGTWKWTPAAPVARVPSPRRTPDTSRALCPNPATQAVRGPWTAALGLLRAAEGGRHRPFVASSRCRSSAYRALSPFRLLGELRSGSRHRHRRCPSCLGCLRPGWRADPRTRRSRPPRQLRAPTPRPAPGMRAS